MPTVEHGGIYYEINEDGFLVEFPKEIDRNWIDYICCTEKFDGFTPEHMEVLKKLHGYYAGNKTMPKIRQVPKIVNSTMHIYAMFGNLLIVSRMAGFPGEIC